jgi:hypothetical protein
VQLTYCYALDTDLAAANTGKHAVNYTGTKATGDHQYLVTAVSTGTANNGAATTVGVAPTAPLSGDSLFATQPGTAATAVPHYTPSTYTISRQTWNGSSWGSATPAFTVTISPVTYQSFVSATAAASYFPNKLDVTQYNTGTGGANGSTGPGDLYVDGVNDGRLSLLSDNDLIVTGDITDASSDPTVNAVDLVAGNNVRNYNPVSCDDQTAADINATTPGSCPNDLTGLTTASLESNGVLNASHPANQYDNLACDFSSVSNPNNAAYNLCPRRIDAAVFALSGSFMTDNYNRGGALGNLTINGGLYQSFRGANGTQWAYSTSDPVRPTSGYRLNYNYVNLQFGRLPYAPPTKTGTTTKTWNIVSISDTGN